MGMPNPINMADITKKSVMVLVKVGTGSHGRSIDYLNWLKIVFCSFSYISFDLSSYCALSAELPINSNIINIKISIFK